MASKSTQNSNSWKWPTIGAVTCLLLGVSSGLITPLGLGWYAPLIKAPGTPPPWVFGPVWSCLYILMGIALGRLINARDWKSTKLFCAQFALNLLWTPLFFLFHQVAWALGNIVLMWILLVLTLLNAKKTDPLATRLLLPYLIWVTYATYLNAGILYLN